MKKAIAVVLILTASLLTGCATTEYRSYEGKSNVIDGKGGTKVVVAGMEIWDNGEPPRKFKIIGIIEDQRPGGLIPMAQLRGDMVEQARKVNGDAIIQLSNASQIAGYYTSGSASAYAYGNSANAYGSSTTLPVRRNFARFAVIKYAE